MGLFGKRKVKVPEIGKLETYNNNNSENGKKKLKAVGSGIAAGLGRGSRAVGRAAFEGAKSAAKSGGSQLKIFAEQKAKERREYQKGQRAGRLVAARRAGKAAAIRPAPSPFGMGGMGGGFDLGIDANKMLGLKPAGTRIKRSKKKRRKQKAKGRTVYILIAERSPGRALPYRFPGESLLVQSPRISG